MSLATFGETPTVRVTDALSVTLTCALHDAARRGHASVLLEHFLAAAVLDETVSAALACAASSRELVLAEIDALSSAVPTSGVRSHPSDVSLSPALCDLLVSAGRKSKKHSAVSLAGVLWEMSALEDSCVVILVRGFRPVLDLAPQPVSTTDGASSAGQGSLPYRSAPSLAHVVLWDDPRSMMEQVVHVLCEAFGKPEAEAVHLMLTVHYAGFGKIGTFPRDEAVDLCQKATAFARDLRAPLRITVETNWNGLGRLERLRRASTRDQTQMTIESATGSIDGYLALTSASGLSWSVRLS